MTETITGEAVAQAAASAEPSNALAPMQQLALVPDADFASLLEGADFVKGATLVEKATLVGKALAITEVHFYPGLGSFFAAVTAVTQDNVTVVFNDGSTGIRRQLVAYLTGKGIIDPGKGEESGPETRYDNPPQAWKSPENAKDIAEDEGFPLLDPATRKGALVCPRGLRVSEYEYPEGSGQMAKTYYLG